MLTQKELNRIWNAPNTVKRSTGIGTKDKITSWIGAPSKLSGRLEGVAEKGPMTTEKENPSKKKNSSNRITPYIEDRVQMGVTTK